MRAGVGLLRCRPLLGWLGLGALEDALSIDPDSAFDGPASEDAGVAELLNPLPGDPEKCGGALDADVAGGAFPCLAAAQELLDGLLGDAVTNDPEVSPFDESVDP